MLFRSTPNDLRWFATGGTMAPNGVFTAGSAPGIYTVTVTARRLKATAQVTIKTFAPPIVRLVITPSTANLNVGQQYQFTAAAYDIYNRPVNINPIWRVTGGGTMHSNGVFHATHAGQFTITVGIEGIAITGSAIITVSHVQTVTRMVISPANTQVYPGQQVQFSAIAYDQYGRVVPCNPIWQANGGNMDQSGRYHAHHTPGVYQVWARDRGSNVQANASVQIIGSPIPPIPPVPSDGRIVITKVDSGGGNFFSPKVKMDLEVFGRNLQSVKLYAVLADGRLSEIDAASCTNGSKIYFNTKYDRMSTREFEVRLFDTRGNIVARERRDAK